MRSVWIGLLICSSLILASCNIAGDQNSPVHEAKEHPEVSKPTSKEKHKVKDVKTYTPLKQSFVSTYGFLSNEEVLIAEQQNSKFSLESYHLFTGEKKTIFLLDNPPIQVLIHPSKKYIYLHTSTNSSTSDVTMINTDGKVIHEFEVKASELSLEWNSLNPALLALSAFQRDWSFQSYIYNGEQSKLIPIHPTNPFIWWSDDKSLLYTDWKENSLEGGPVKTYDWATNKITEKGLDKVIHMKTYHQQLLTVQIDQAKEEFVYTLLDGGQKVVEFRTPAISNYSQWFVPQTQWLEDGSLIALKPLTGGLMDGYDSEFELVKVKDGEIVTLVEKLPHATFSCSNDGSICLYGYTLDEVISFNPFEKKRWLQDQNEE